MANREPSTATGQVDLPGIHTEGLIHLDAASLVISVDTGKLVKPRLILPQPYTADLHPDEDANEITIHGNKASTERSVASLFLPNTVSMRLERLLITGNGNPAERHKASSLRIMGNGKKFGSKNLDLTTEVPLTALTHNIEAQNVDVTGHLAYVVGLTATTLTGSVKLYGPDRDNKIGSTEWRGAQPGHLDAVIFSPYSDPSSR